MIRLSGPIIPSLWFDGNAEQAVDFYVSTFADSRITRVTRYGEDAPFPAGTPLTIDFELGGRPFNAINGGPQFTFDKAVSFVIEVDTQEENDEVWNTLIADGGAPGPCGWLTDRFGLKWQVSPRQFFDILNSGDAEGIARATELMYTMQQLDIAALQDAFEGRTPPPPSEPPTR